MRWLLIAAILAALIACSDPPPPEKSVKTVFDPLLEQRDKAQEMADKLPQERKDSLDRAIDADAN